jgi:hypothetical protein
MSQTRKPRGVRATREGLQKLQQAKAAKRNDKGKPWTYFDVATAAEVDEKTVQRFFRGEAKDRNYAIAITNALNLEITEVVDPKEWNPVEQTAGAINWRDVCGKVLAQQRENQRLRRQATERGFELNVYVPLGLVERKQQQRRRGDVPLEEVYQLTEEVITKEYDNDQFLTEVIESGKSRRIAIIGEPGAGKTTLQEKIAIWLQDNNKGLPICIPLGGLQGKSLEYYLQQIWLKAALGFIEPDASGVEAQAFASLQKQFREGKVWLLLDGVDEMAATSPVEALATIKEQLTDWLVEARVVLTCRLNVWDANVKNTLTGFETYRTLEFKPEQVEDFIRQWFAKAEESQQYCSDKTDLTPPAPLPYQGMGEPHSPLLAGEGQGDRFACASELQQGEELIKKLQEPGKERIRELVRNPLRLSLLCQTSYLLPMDEPLPETKAALYERFTRYFYEWKQEQHLDLSQQDELIDELHEALGKLALAGINSATRFRLERKLARQEMGDRLFKLVDRLNWLVLVDREADTDEAVYAFFHPTFQEYFAACAIDDWHFFLNHVPDNPMHGNYRIFEPQWKEVILLWLGRQDIASEQKEEFICALGRFEDGCEDFYRYRTICLIAAGIAEFEECEWADEILPLLVTGVFGYFDTKEQRWQRCAYCMQEAFMAALRETDRNLVIAGLSDLLDCNLLDRQALCDVAVYLLRISPGNPKAINALSNVLDSSSPYQFAGLDFEPIDLPREKAAFWLLENNPDPKNSKAIKILLKPQHMSWDTWERLQANDANALSKLLEVSKRQYTLEEKTDYWEYYLKVTERGNPDEITTIIQQLRTTPNPNHQDISKLGLIGLDNLDAINYFMELARSNQNNSENENVYWDVLKTLGRIGANNSDAINYLLRLANSGRELERFWAITAIRQSLHGKLLPRIVTGLKRYLQEPFEDNIYERLSSFCYEIIWRCAEKLPYPDFYQAWHQTTI